MAVTQLNEQSSTFEKFTSEEELKEYLVNDAVKKYSNLFGTQLGTTINFDLNSYLFTIGAGAVFNGGVTTNTVNIAFNRSADFSQTNTQVSGVDEADLVETDGKYIYQVTGQNLTIVDARNPEQLGIVSQTDLKNLGNIQGAYLYGDKLTVISTVSPVYLYNSLFNYNFTSFNPKVNVSVFNVSDRTNVVLEEKTQIEGSLISSRAVGDQVYVVTQSGFGLPRPQVSLQRYETQEEYLTRLEGRVTEVGLPNFTTFDSQNNILLEGLLNSAQNIYKPLEDNPVQLTSVSTFDVDDNQVGPQLSIGIPTSSVREIFSSRENLYLLEPDASGTDLFKINLDKLDLVAVGKAPGRVLNQFSVDEDKGFVRVATTIGSGNSSKNNVYVLEQVGQQLNVVGSIEGIAPGERIYSARFQGDYGFVVTFRQIDPFFTLDLSNPTNPTVAGELKLPGFSEYLQVIENEDTTQVLGIGRDGSALKVSLFDVTDFQNPQEVDSFLFGRYSSSEAQWDQQAVSYFPETQLLAIPFRNDGKNGLRVFDIDPQEGLTNLGDISHEGVSIRRSLRIGADLYVISNAKITSHDLFTLGQKSEVILPNSSSPTPILSIDPIFTRPIVFNPTPILDVSVTTL
ncbi:beta-propeller domain-containing protein [Iningainema tapete]|uniref:Beta-propeller domain-containing protein n=1 Tax=Iningainema tapete BLCC-T55 TaxID=2748662 RepID=A0A8J6XZT0_9CYAN|nr:beta-propeller domain-containing protein [Iningainema tapete]MBD2776323.1 beta-propeller domain-containing protein [Iningainema tapete BLCC-T55]